MNEENLSGVLSSCIFLLFKQVLWSSSKQCKVRSKAEMDQRTQQKGGGQNWVNTGSHTYRAPEIRCSCCISCARQWRVHIFSYDCVWKSYEVIHNPLPIWAILKQPLLIFIMDSSTYMCKVILCFSEILLYTKWWEQLISESHGDRVCAGVWMYKTLM